VERIKAPYLLATRWLLGVVSPKSTGCSCLNGSTPND